MSFYFSHRPADPHKDLKMRGSLAIVALTILLGSYTLPCFAGAPIASYLNSDVTTYTDTTDLPDITAQTQLLINASADHIFVFSTNRGTTLFSSAVPDRLNIPAASKLMTAVIALEDIPQDTMITISEEVEEVDMAGTSPVFIKKGAKYTVDFLVSAMLYCNSDAAALSLAEYVSNDESSFVEKMNNRAKSLSMKNTNYINSSGTYEIDEIYSEMPTPTGSKQVSTIEDLSILFRYALSLSDFRDIFTDYNALEFQDTGKPLSISSQVISAWGIDHVAGAQFFPDKSNPAGASCLLALASEENFEIGIILTNFSNSNIYADLKQTVNSIYDFYEVSDLVEAGDPYRTVEIEGLSEPVSAVFKSNIMYIHPIGRFYAIPESKFTPSKVLSLPVKKGDTLGQVEIILEDGTRIITEVVAEDAVTVKTSLISQAQGLMDLNKNISILILCCFICLMISIVRILILWIRKTRGKSSHN